MDITEIILTDIQSDAEMILNEIKELEEHQLLTRDKVRVVQLRKALKQFIKEGGVTICVME
jgi:hypothetical protein